MNIQTPQKRHESLSTVDDEQLLVVCSRFSRCTTVEDSLASAQLIDAINLQLVVAEAEPK